MINIIYLIFYFANNKKTFLIFNLLIIIIVGYKKTNKKLRKIKIIYTKFVIVYEEKLPRGKKLFRNIG